MRALAGPRWPELIQSLNNGTGFVALTRLSMTSLIDIADAKVLDES